MAGALLIATSTRRPLGDVPTAVAGAEAALAGSPPIIRTFKLAQTVASQVSRALVRITRKSR